jgi:hypothetical protein
MFPERSFMEEKHKQAAIIASSMKALYNKTVSEHK